MTTWLLVVFSVVGRIIISWRTVASSGFGLGAVNVPMLLRNQVAGFVVWLVGHALIWGCMIALMALHSWWLGLLVTMASWPMASFLITGLCGRSMVNAAELRGRLESRKAFGTVRGRNVDHHAFTYDDHPGDDWEEVDLDISESNLDSEDDGDQKSLFQIKSAGFETESTISDIDDDLRLKPERRDFRGVVGQPLCPICREYTRGKGFCSDACAGVGARYGVAPHSDSTSPIWLSLMKQLAYFLVLVVSMSAGAALVHSCRRG